MIKIQVEGQADQVQPFIYDLQSRPQIEWITQEMEQKDSGENEVSVRCCIQFHPGRRIRIIRLTTPEGKDIHIPLSNLIHAELDEGVYVFAGKVYDIFS